jgi:hypothetical protein
MMGTYIFVARTSGEITVSADTTSVEDYVSLEVPFELDEKRLYKLKSELSQKAVAAACALGGVLAAGVILGFFSSLFNADNSIVSNIVGFAVIISGLVVGYKGALMIDKKCADIRENYIREVSPQIRKVLNGMGWAAENWDVANMMRNQSGSFPRQNGVLYRVGFYRTSSEGLTMMMDLVNKKQEKSRADKAFALWEKENPEVLISKDVESAFKAGYTWND